MNLHQKAAAIAVFKVALDHVITQGEPCVREGENLCVYRNAKGHGCAFAPSIKNYTPALEGQPAEDILLYQAKNLHAWARECPLIFASKIQEAHDFASGDYGDTFIKQFKANMLEIANDYPELQLKVPE